MRISVLLILCLAIASCSNDLELYTDTYVETPVIYGIVDLAIDSQTVRVNKTFRNKESAYETMQVYDSLCFENVLVQFTCYPSGRIFTLNDHARPGKNSARRDIFSIPTSALDAGIDSLKLSVTNLNNGSIFSAMAVNIVPPEYRGHPANVINDGGNYILFFPRTGNLFDAVVRLHYTEYEPDKPADSVKLFVDFVVPDIVNSNDRYNIAFKFMGYDIITSAVALIGKSTKTRKFRGFSTYISIESNDMQNFLAIQRPSIHIVQKNTFFSNIKGGIGLFTARGTNLRTGLQPSAAMEFQLKEKLNIEL
jgi:hypothetical protein